jgi:HK97 family phage prohead protease
MPPKTTCARDIVESIDRGDVTGMSFAFRTLEDDWYMEDGIPICEVIDMRIREVSIVSFPAYQDTDVQVAQRAMQACQAEQGKDRQSAAWWTRWHRTLLAR